MTSRRITRPILIQARPSPECRGARPTKSVKSTPTFQKQQKLFGFQQSLESSAAPAAGELCLLTGPLGSYLLRPGPNNIRLFVLNIVLTDSTGAEG